MSTRKLEVDGTEVTLSTKSPFDRRVPMSQEEQDLSAFSSCSLALYSLVQEMWSTQALRAPGDNCLPELSQLASEERKRRSQVKEYVRRV
jgi:hypothetical protein